MARPPSRRRPNLPKEAVVAIAAVALVSLTVLALPPWTPHAPSATPSPGATAVPSSPTEPEGDWAAVVLEDVPAVATLAASRSDEAGIAPDATFALASLTGDPAMALARGVEVSPEAPFDVVAGADDAHAVLKPRSSLSAGQVYRFTLRTADGALAGSWAFRVRAPVAVVSTIPGERTSGVPIDTGFEVTFNQDGVASMADHFTIAPAVAGRFEQHGRTQVFVPDRLAPATLYMVTIQAGLSRTGTDLQLESDVVVRFETGGGTAPAPRLRFGREVVEASPDEAPAMAVDVNDFETDPDTVPASAGVTVYRLPSEAAATAALGAFVMAPRWTSFSDPLIDTTGLPVATRFSAPLETLGDSSYRAMRFPAPLAPGFYVVELAGARPSHAFLQVTAVSAWVSVLIDRTVVWVNDVVGDRPIAGATVALADGSAFGAANRDGIVNAATPDALVPPAEAGDRIVPAHPPLLVVRAPDGGVLLVAFEVGFDDGIYRGEWWELYGSANSTNWSLLETERSLYRTTDAIDAWGYLRGRDDGAVPPSVELRLIPARSTGSADPPALAQTTVTPDAAGAFLGSLRFEGAPLGSYYLQARVDGRVVASRWLEVGVIRKPAYQLALTPSRRAVIVGTTVRWTAAASFFDGSPVPSLPLRAIDGERDVTLGPTDVGGHASIDLTATIGSDSDALEHARPWWMSLLPAGPEEGDISASSDVLVFPSTLHLAADGSVADGRLRVTGSLHAVDLAKVERQLADGTWADDPSGSPAGGRTVTIAVTELVPVAKLVGTDYDFIEKVVRPRYDYTIERRAVRSLAVTTAADGSLSFETAVPDPTHGYEVVLSTPDAAGRVARRTLVAGRRLDLWSLTAGIRFQNLDGSDAGSAPFRIGEQVTWRMTDDNEPLPSGGSNRYLYVVAQRGLRSVTETDSATFSRRFEAADAPGVFVMGVRFTGSTYAPKAAAWADFDRAERELSVMVSVDREEYRPGQDVAVSIRTADTAGRPVAASVILQAVDEKLFAIGAASAPRPLESLYGRVDSGIVRLTSTHQVPTQAGPEGEGGSASGDDGLRSDFRDTLAFRSLDTNASGEATTTIRLSDDLTAWHLSASALTGGLQAGVGELLVPVGLPLFADAVVAAEYLTADRPTIRLRAYGEALQAGDRVEFTVASSTLGLAATIVAGRAFADVAFELPPLALGRQVLEIGVRAPTRLDSAGRPLSDRLQRTFLVVESRLTAAHSEYAQVGRLLPSVSGSAAATYTFTDAGRGRYLPLLEQAVVPAGMRMDRGLAQSLARSLLVEVYGIDPTTLPADAYDPVRYPIRQVDDVPGGSQPGIPLVPHGGADPWLAARVAIVAPEAIDGGELASALTAILAMDVIGRDLRIAALAGLAALGEPVLDELLTARQASDLTLGEQLDLALGFAAVGDDATALAIERDLLARYGQRLGPWVRLAAGSGRDAVADATARLAVLASELGDPLAPAMLDYVAANPSRETSHALEAVGAVRRILERTPAASASFAYTVDGRRTVVQLDPGRAVSILLTARQRATLEVERLTGEVGVAVTWREPVDVEALEPDPALTLARTLPTSPIPADRLVTVDLGAIIPATAPASSCYEVVEQVPSGLAPTWTGSWTTSDPKIAWPTSIVGQEVRFCVDSGRSTAVRLRYVARVVSSGTFAWEPAILQLEAASAVMTLTPAGTVTIGAP